MGRLFLVHPEGKTYNCKFCDAKLSHVGSLVSKALHCSSGRAYLFNKVINITVECLESDPLQQKGRGRRRPRPDENEERTLLSGTYTVKDIFCRICGQILGWKYEKSHEESQKYNEGKFVLERVKIIDEDDDEFYIDTR